MSRGLTYASKKQFGLFLSSFALLCSPLAYAGANNFWDNPDIQSSESARTEDSDITGYPFSNWRIVLAGGGGGSLATNLGNSNNFSIKNPSTDEFYNYSSSDSTNGEWLYNIFVGGQWPICPNFGLITGIDYYNNFSFASKGKFTQGVDAPSDNTYKYQYKIKAQQFLAEGKVFTTLALRYHPYLMAGAGVSVNKAYDYSTNVPPFLTFTRQYSSHQISSFSYILGAGIDYDITPDLRFGIGYHFVSFGEVKLGGANVDGTKVAGTLSRSNLYVNELVGQVTVVF